MTDETTPPEGDDKPEQADVYTLSDLEQVKVLADPLRVRILETLGIEGLTTKQVAEKLGEKPTRLYHHVEALERVGLIRLDRTQQVRGTVEKYYVAVARAFRADPALFSAAEDDEKTRTLTEMVGTVMGNTTDDLLALVRSGHDLALGKDGVLSYTEIHASNEEIDALMSKLMAMLEDLQKSCCRGKPREGDRRFRLTLAFFPLDRSDPSRKDA